MSIETDNNPEDVLKGPPKRQSKPVTEPEKDATMFEEDTSEPAPIIPEIKPPQSKKVNHVARNHVDDQSKMVAIAAMIRSKVLMRMFGRELTREFIIKNEPNDGWAALLVFAAGEFAKSTGKMPSINLLYEYIKEQPGLIDSSALVDQLEKFVDEFDSTPVDVIQIDDAAFILKQYLHDLNGMAARIVNSNMFTEVSPTQAMEEITRKSRRIDNIGKETGEYVFSFNPEETPPDRAPVLIEDILREGKTMNIISSPKAGKSWIVEQLALCVAAGKEFLGKKCTKGKVILLDTELDSSDLKHRLFDIAKAMDISLADIGQNLKVIHWEEGRQISEIKDEMRGHDYKLCVIDPLYTFLREGETESDDAAMRSIFAEVKSISVETGAAVCIVHHDRKGDNTLQKTSDRGAGSGVQTRRPDAMITFDVMKDSKMLEARFMVRGFKPLNPIRLTLISESCRALKVADDQDDEKVEVNEFRDAISFAGMAARFEPDTRQDILSRGRSKMIDQATGKPISHDTAVRLFNRATEGGVIVAWPGSPDRGHPRWMLKADRRQELNDEMQKQMVATLTPKIAC